MVTVPGCVLTCLATGKPLPPRATAACGARKRLGALGAGGPVSSACIYPAPLTTRILPRHMTSSRSPDRGCMIQSIRTGLKFGHMLETRHAKDNQEGHWHCSMVPARGGYMPCASLFFSVSSPATPLSEVAGRGDNFIGGTGN